MLANYVHKYPKYDYRTKRSFERAHYSDFINSAVCDNDDEDANDDDNDNDARAKWL